MVKILKSILKSTSRGILNDPEIRKIINRYPKLSRFIKNRLTPNEKYGLYLTIGLIITLFFIYLFFGVIKDYIGQEALIRADLRIINLISQFRTPFLNQFMLFITYLAKGEIIIIAVIFSLIILTLFRKWSYFYSLLISVAGGELFVWIIKNILERPRPPITNALVVETSYSFPSGHSFVAIAFYGLIIFFLFEIFKKRSQRILTTTLGLILIILIGFSRIYLGAHWPSDVLASYTSGLAWLSIIVTITHIKKKFHPRINPPHLKSKTILKISLLLIITFFTFVANFYLNHPLKPITVTSTPKTIIPTEKIDTKLFETLPKISESISGFPAEPINIIVIGSKTNLNKAFINSGWFLIDELNFKTSFKIIDTVIHHKVYPQIPGIPVFWNTQPNSLGFGKPSPQDSISSRHHIHFWETQFITPDNQSIWVGTAHFDEKIKTKFKIIMPFHSTEILVDKEREEIKNELGKNGFLKSSEKIDLTGLTYGAKKSGNSFLTDGKAYILYLKNNE